MTYAKVATTLILLAFLSIGVSVHSASAAGNTPTCQPKPLDALELPPEAGTLLYRGDEGRVVSTNGRFQHNLASKYEGFRDISPNGEYVAVRASDDTSNWVEVYGQTGALIYSGAPARGNILSLQWLGNEKLIELILTSVHRDLACNTCIGKGTVAYFVIDPFARTYTYVVPKDEAPFYQGDFSVLDSNYNFTYDGRYLFNSVVLFDFETNQPLFVKGGYFSSDTQQLGFQNFQFGIPAASSYHLLILNGEKFTNTGEYSVSIYDFDSDTVTQLKALSPKAEMSHVSWSPDEKKIAYQLFYSSEDLTSSRQVELAQLETSDIHSTCFSLPYEIKGSAPYQNAQQSVPPDFAWSRDSRYLALQGIIEGQSTEDSLGIYIYDTQTGDIYEVYHGRSDIIGWMANPAS